MRERATNVESQRQDRRFRIRPLRDRQSRQTHSERHLLRLIVVRRPGDPSCLPVQSENRGRLVPRRHSVHPLEQVDAVRRHGYQTPVRAADESQVEVSQQDCGGFKRASKEAGVTSSGARHLQTLEAGPDHKQRLDRHGS